MTQEAINPQVVRPLDLGSARATHFEVRFDGGAFTFHVFEQRESGQPRNGPLVKSWELVEIARFAVSPISLGYLSGAVEAAKRSYHSAMGHPLPDPAKVTAALNKLATGSG